jgi:hypothetical protein
MMTVGNDIGGHPTGNDVYAWTDDGIYMHQIGSPQMFEVLDETASIPGVKGMYAAYDDVDMTGATVWFWNGNHLYAHPRPAVSAIELTQVGGAPVVGVRGSIDADDLSGLNPTERTRWFWTDSHLYGHDVGTTNVLEITAPEGGPIDSIQGMITSYDATSPTLSIVWIWTDDRVLGHATGTLTTVEITDTTGASIPGVRGMLSTPDWTGTNPTRRLTWMWNGEHVYGHDDGTTHVVEITRPDLQPLTDVQGIVSTEDLTNVNNKAVWIWNDEGLFVHQLGTTTTFEITDQSDEPIENIRGVMAALDWTSLTGTSVWVWTPDRVLVHVVGTTRLAEITAPGGGSILGARGVFVSQDEQVEFNPTGSNVWIWTPDRVYAHMVGSLTTAEITDPGMASIPGVWGFVQSKDETGFNDLGWNVWLRNQTNVYAHSIGSTQAGPITNPGGGAILSPAYDPPAYGQAMLLNYWYRTGGAGIDKDRGTAPFATAQVGKELLGSVWDPTGTVAMQEGLSTLVADGGGHVFASFVTGTGLVDQQYPWGGNRPSMAVLLTTVDLQSGVSEETPAAPGRMLRARPNPFRAGTEIAFRVPEAAKVVIAAYDLTGRRVRRLAERTYPAGEYRLQWDGGDETGRPLPAGVYFIRMDVEGSRDAIRVVLMR